jgi:FkbM family methyltransferase
VVYLEGKNGAKVFGTFDSMSRINRSKGLVELNDCFNQLGLDVFLTDGSLLGLVRSGQLIPWDPDHELTIERSVFCGNFFNIIKKLKDNKFEILYFDTDYDNLKLNVIKYDEKYCIITLYEKGRYFQRKDFRYPAHFFKSYSTLDALDSTFKTPNQTDEYLVYQYGENWKVPLQLSEQSEYLSPSVYIPRWLKLIQRLKTFFQKKCYDLMTKSRSGFRREVYREPLFIQMLSESMIKKNVTLIEIGSSDGEEIKHLLANYDDNIDEVVLIEPRKHAREIYAAQTKESRKITIYPYAVSAKRGIGEFYQSTAFPNLSSRIKNRYTDTIETVQYATLWDILKKHQNIDHLVVKMDIEGTEVEVLQSFVDKTQHYNSVSFIIELHQFEYNPKNSMRCILEKYISSGFIVKYVETAGSELPAELAAYRQYVVRTVGGRSLIKVTETKSMLDLICDNYGEVCMNNTKFTPKLIRSIYLTNKL